MKCVKEPLATNAGYDRVSSIRALGNLKKLKKEDMLNVLQP
jgi:hypothetical protein